MKSVASRQPLVRAKNPWGAGEAESAVGSRYSDGPRDPLGDRDGVLPSWSSRAQPCTLGGAVVYYHCVPRPIPNWNAALIAEPGPLHQRAGRRDTWVMADEYSVKRPGV